ncbi:hypothetical protein RRG08_003256 [Elysia crispata]|uniref:Uncharacterized protein n=1 Tax=Elysia crispata TaxID=231223 RepID=A0AAE1AZJ6_9GAST|nr:hypothetical protein RRG08_003256 [Elysia crispata]
MSAQRGGGIGPNECAETYGIPKATLERHLDNSKKYGNKQETRKTSSSLQHHTLHQMTTQSSDVFGEVWLLRLIQLYIWTETVVPNPVIMLQKTSHAGSLRNRMIDFCLKKFEILSEYMKNDVLNADIPAHISMPWDSKAFSKKGKGVLEKKKSRGFDFKPIQNNVRKYKHEV